MRIVNTFVLPHYRYSKVNRCIETLYKYTPPNFRLIVVDQNPDSKIDSSKVHLHIKAYKPLGFTKACNIGWKLADTKYVTLLNDDVEFVNAKWWDGIIESFSEPQILAVNPMSARDYSMGLKILDNVPYKEDFTEDDYKTMLGLPFKTMQCQAMFCTTFERERALRVGYFDEFFTQGGDDTDWIIRAKLLREQQNKFRGYEVISTPFSYVWHWWRQSNEDPTFIKARVQLAQKWGYDFDMFKLGATNIIQPKLIIRTI